MRIFLGKNQWWFHVLQQTLNAQEDEDTRLLRVKQEAAVIEEHNKKQESKETVSNKEAAEVVTDFEVG